MASFTVQEAFIQTYLKQKYRSTQQSYRRSFMTRKLAMKERDQLHEQFSQTRCPLDWLNYKKSTKHCQI